MILCLYLKPGRWSENCFDFAVCSRVCVWLVVIGDQVDCVHGVVGGGCWRLVRDCWWLLVVVGDGHCYNLLVAVVVVGCFKMVGGSWWGSIMMIMVSGAWW